MCKLTGSVRQFRAWQSDCGLWHHLTVGRGSVAARRWRIVVVMVKIAAVWSFRGRGGVGVWDGREVLDSLARI
jgi:hypothetical protein